MAGFNKIGIRSHGKDGKYAVPGKVNAQRSLNSQDRTGYTSAQAKGIVKTNAQTQRPSFLEKQYGEKWHTGNDHCHCDSGTSTGSRAMNTINAVGAGLGMLSSMGSIFMPGANPSMSFNPAAPLPPTGTFISNPGASLVADPAGAIISSSDNAFIANMENATNSTDLRTAIGAADTELTNLNSNISALEQNAGEAKIKLEKDENKDGINDLARNIDLAEQKEAKLAKSVQSCENAKNQTLQVLENCKAQLSQLGQDYITAVNNVTTAETNLADLETQLANLPENATTEKQVLERKIEEAQTALDTAKTTRDNLADQISKLEDASEENKLHLKQMVKNHQDAIKGLEDAKSAHKDALEALNGLKTDKTNLEQAIKDYKEAKKQINELTNAINSNKKRLIKLEEAEAKALEKVNKDIGELDKKNGKLLGKIDITDGYSRAEERRNAEVEDNNVRISALKERKAQLEAQIEATVLASGETGKFLDGQEYKSKVIDGKRYYCVDNKLISSAEYQNLLTQKYNALVSNNDS